MRKNCTIPPSKIITDPNTGTTVCYTLTQGHNPATMSPNALQSKQQETSILDSNQLGVAEGEITFLRIER